MGRTKGSTEGESSRGKKKVAPKHARTTTPSTGNLSYERRRFDCMEHALIWEKFGHRSIASGRSIALDWTYHGLLNDYLADAHWGDLVELPSIVYEDCVRLFYCNLTIHDVDGSFGISSYVMGRCIELDVAIIGDLFHLPDGERVYFDTEPEMRVWLEHQVDESGTPHFLWMRFLATFARLRDHCTDFPILICFLVFHCFDYGCWITSPLGRAI
ncbi:hypothetical protein Dimus_038433 [Dionaea muscipula]